MPIPKKVMLRNTLVHFDLTPCQMKRIINKNNITTAEQLVKYMEDEKGMVMSDWCARYILLEKEYLLPLR